jgi:hypothetical protein
MDGACRRLNKAKGGNIMATLVLLFCLGTEQAQCVERRPVYEEPLGLMACMVGGQFAGAEFLQTHPGWRLAKWRCETGPRQEPA